MSMTPAGKGVLSAVIAFAIWGILPLYWKAFFSFAPASTLIAHRTLWSLLVLVPIVCWRGRLPEIAAALRQPRLAAWHLLSGTLLASNWLLYVWSTLNERIVEGALGYYLNPFLSMLLGYFFFRERHSPGQKAAIGLAMAGVALQFLAVRGVPWLAISLAVTFAFYGLVRKRAPLGAVSGLFLETLILAPVAGLFLWLGTSAATTHATAQHLPLLATTGIVTVIPLLCFANGARNLRLTTVGILQFIGPTCQLLIGWLIYHEAMPPLRLASFALIWGAVALYAFSALRAQRRSALQDSSRGDATFLPADSQATERN
jgi:chloramphenicol-sensitive protein RarD